MPLSQDALGTEESNLNAGYLILVQGGAKDIDTPLSRAIMKAPAIMRAQACINMFSVT